MKKLYSASNGFLAICTIAMAIPYASAQSTNANAAVNANDNALNAIHNAGVGKASRPLFNSDGTPANDAALGIPIGPTFTLPPKPKTKPHSHHEISLGPVEHKKYPSTPQQEITSLR